MRTTTFFAVAAACLAVGACESTDVGSESANQTESLQVRWVNGHDVYRAQILESMAANGGHSFGTYDPDSFSARAAKDDMIARDRDRGCEGRIWSKSRQEAVQTFEEFITSEDWAIGAEDMEDYSLERLQQAARELFADPDNLGVFSSIFDPAGVDTEHPWACWYWRFYIYRKNGTVIHFDFDWGD